MKISKRVLLITVLALALSTSVFAQTQSSVIDSKSTAANEGNNQSLTYNQAPPPADTTAHVTSSGTQTIKTAPSVMSPSLTSAGFSCLGSKSAGISVIGLGATGGTTVEDEQCNAREWGKLYASWGLRDVALARICQVESERNALESTGFLCPQTKAERLRTTRDNTTPTKTMPY